jgi:transposase
MVYAGLDVHKRCTQICIEDESGTLLERRILTERHRLLEEFGGRSRMRILIESSTEGEWVARCLESAGHEVVVGDPNFAPMYAQRSRRVKADRRDARALMGACKLGAYKPALAARRQEGIKPERKSSSTFAARVRELGVPADLAVEISPVLDLIDTLTVQIRRADERVAEVAKYETHQRLMSVPGVGPVTAVAFGAALDDPKRFRGPKQVRAYFGLVPREHSSGEKELVFSNSRSVPVAFRSSL